MSTINANNGGKTRAVNDGDPNDACAIANLPDEILYELFVALTTKATHTRMSIHARRCAARNGFHLIQTCWRIRAVFTGESVGRQQRLEVLASMTTRVTPFGAAHNPHTPYLDPATTSVANHFPHRQQLARRMITHQQLSIFVRCGFTGGAKANAFDDRSLRAYNRHLLHHPTPMPTPSFTTARDDDTHPFCQRSLAIRRLNTGVGTVVTAMCVANTGRIFYTTRPRTRTSSATDASIVHATDEIAAPGGADGAHAVLAVHPTVAELTCAANGEMCVFVTTAINGSAFPNRTVHVWDVSTGLVRVIKAPSIANINAQLYIHRAWFPSRPVAISNPSNPSNSSNSPNPSTPTSSVPPTPTKPTTPPATAPANTVATLLLLSCSRPVFASTEQWLENGGAAFSGRVGFYISTVQLRSDGTQTANHKFAPLRGPPQCFVGAGNQILVAYSCSPAMAFGSPAFGDHTSCHLRVYDLYAHGAITATPVHSSAIHQMLAQPILPAVHSQVADIEITVAPVAIALSTFGRHIAVLTLGGFKWRAHRWPQCVKLALYQRISPPLRDHDVYEVANGSRDVLDLSITGHHKAGGFKISFSQTCNEFLFLTHSTREEGAWRLRVIRITPYGLKLVETAPTHSLGELAFCVREEGGVVARVDDGLVVVSQRA